MENRITELEQMIKNAVIIDESELSVDSVSEMCIRDRPLLLRLLPPALPPVS